MKYFSWVLSSYKQLRDLEILSRKLEMLKVLYFQTHEKKHDKSLVVSPLKITILQYCLYYSTKLLTLKEYSSYIYHNKKNFLHNRHNRKNLLVMTRNFYAKSVNITMKTLSEDYFLYLKIKRLGSLHLIQGESIEPWMYVR